MANNLETFAAYPVKISPALQEYLDGVAASRSGAHETPQERNARLRRGDPAPGHIISLQANPTSQMIGEAKRLLPMVTQVLQPMPLAELDAACDKLCKFLAICVSNPPSTEARMLRKQGILLIAGDYPACIFTSELPRIAAKRFGYWPSVAELTVLFDELAQPIREAAANMKILAQKNVCTPERTKKRTPEEKNAVAQAMEKIRKNLAR